jgi:hypothetical protein
MEIDNMATSAPSVVRHDVAKDSRVFLHFSVAVMGNPLEMEKTKVRERLWRSVELQIPQFFSRQRTQTRIWAVRFFIKKRRKQRKRPFSLPTSRITPGGP